MDFSRTGDLMVAITNTAMAELYPSLRGPLLDALTDHLVWTGWLDLFYGVQYPTVTHYFQGASR
jgi:hypothetical protein